MGLSEQQTEEAPERQGRFGKHKNLLPLPGIDPPNIGLNFYHAKKKLHGLPISPSKQNSMRQI
jgi:hypothetical protein